MILLLKKKMERKQPKKKKIEWIQKDGFECVAILSIYKLAAFSVLICIVCGCPRANHNLGSYDVAISLNVPLECKFYALFSHFVQFIRVMNRLTTNQTRKKNVKSNTVIVELHEYLQHVWFKCIAVGSEKTIVKWRKYELYEKLVFTFELALD